MTTNIEERIKIWRSEISNGALSRDDIDELQSNLEDNIDEFLSKDLSEDDAWLLAVHRMGSAESIKLEFQKVKNSKVPVFNHVFYWIMLISIVVQLVSIGKRIIEYIWHLGAFPTFQFILFIALSGVILRIVYRGKEIKSDTRMKVFTRAIVLLFVSFILLVIKDFQDFDCRNENKVFSQFKPETEVYKTELIRLLTKMGSDNLYYKSVSYLNKDKKTYLLVKVIGKDFCADLPLNITNSKNSSMANLIRVKGLGYSDLILKGLKFDMIYNKSDIEFVFRDLERVVD